MRFKRLERILRTFRIQHDDILLQVTIKIIYFAFWANKKICVGQNAVFTAFNALSRRLPHQHKKKLHCRGKCASRDVGTVVSSGDIA